MLQKKLINLNEIEVGMKVLTNGSSGPGSPTCYIFGTVRCIHDNHLCVEYKDHSLSENCDLDGIDKMPIKGGGDGCGSAWYCNTTLSSLKIYEVYESTKFKVGDKVRYRGNLTGIIGCICKDMAYMRECTEDDGRIYAFPAGGTCNEHQNFMGYGLENLELISGEGSISTWNRVEPATEPKKTKMLNKLTSKIRRFFSKDQQTLYKAGFITDCFDLTTEGQNELNAIVREHFMEDLVKVAREKIAEEKEDNE